MGLENTLGEFIPGLSHSSLPKSLIKKISPSFMLIIHSPNISMLKVNISGPALDTRDPELKKVQAVSKSWLL